MLVITCNKCKKEKEVLYKLSTILVGGYIIGADGWGFFEEINFCPECRKEYEDSVENIKIKAMKTFMKEF